MENIFEIKEEFKSTIVGYNGSGLPLGERTDLHILAEMAYINPALSIYFKNLPAKEQITAYRTEQFDKKHPAPAKQEPPTQPAPEPEEPEVTPVLSAQPEQETMQAEDHPEVAPDNETDNKPSIDEQNITENIQ